MVVRKPGWACQLWALLFLPQLASTTRIMSIDKKQFAYTPISDEDAPPAYSTDTQPTLLNTTGLIPTPQMQVGGSRNSKSLDVGLDGKRSFNHGLCSVRRFIAPCAAATRTHPLTESSVRARSGTRSRERRSWRCAAPACSSRRTTVA